MSDFESDALASRLRSDPIIGPDLPPWLCKAIAQRVIGWGYTRLTPPGEQQG
jgi:hypothetical protein